MKKSLVISTIATVLVVVVALTTATFAWFSTGTDTTAGSDFTVSTGGGDFRIFPYELSDGGAGAAGAFAGSPVYTLDLVDGISTTTYNAGLLGATMTGDTFNPTMPTTELTHYVNQAGLPAINFAQATTATSGVTMTSNAAKPIVVRFILDTSLETVNMKITATVKQVGDAATRSSVEAAQNIRFVLFGYSDADDTTTQSFVFATPYKTFANAAASGNVASPDYQPADLSAYDLGRTQVVKKVDATFESASLTNIVSGVTQESGEIAMMQGTDVYCTLYVWFDGETMDEGASDGSINFTLEFADADEQTT